MASATVAGVFKKALQQAAVALWQSTEPGVLVSFGHPGNAKPDDIVGFMDVRSQQDPANLGTNRSREEVIELDVLFSIYRGGGAEQEVVCTDRAYYLLGQLENFVRVTDTTVGGTVRHCFLISHTSDGSTDPDVLAAGRFIEVTATFQAYARITN